MPIITGGPEDNRVIENTSTVDTISTDGGNDWVTTGPDSGYDVIDLGSGDDYLEVWPSAYTLNPTTIQLGTGADQARIYNGTYTVDLGVDHDTDQVYFSGAGWVLDTHTTLVNFGSEDQIFAWEMPADPSQFAITSDSGDTTISWHNLSVTVHGVFAPSDFIFTAANFDAPNWNTPGTNITIRPEAFAAPPSAPVDGDGAPGATVFEDLPVGSAVGIDANSTDPNGETVSFSFGFDGDGNPIVDTGQFAIDSSTGIVTLSGALDYETATSHNLTIVATNSDGDSSSSDFTVTVKDAIEGTPGSDNLFGTGGVDHIYGFEGADGLRGGGGSDNLYGGGGDDFINGGNGNDIVDGGPGVDRAGYFQTDESLGGINVSLLLQGSPQNVGSQGSDTLIGIENVSGTPFADTIIGDAGDNWLWGSTSWVGDEQSGSNNDTIDGGGGNDLSRSATAPTS
jgi:Ca2+-binding RTX toxin-like protein